ncbi:hypothetical protein Emtol_2773 [Emticicia oligotrophica DSM 17448]|uniref:DUF4157 domain-containing protein n=1 Tax=Emticicia oligotrophica (strain DSM 17448 / CIP 109782 / MTCC 6937 / GPTSA100-15) TaxID=929562 RepID=A0ABM5N3A6_EMTOG|nr:MULTISPECIES: hypothetical protein [Emticicia]AFK03908.1 hypothetical protein Emtol_2773 [Emticicia oligotrophica DSM 17448]
MIVIKGVPLRKIQGITLFPFIIVRSKKPSKVLINHEMIHIRQQLELLILPFYIWYVGEWLFHYFRCRKFWQAYRKISFECEAYDNEEDFEYLQKRRFWNFLKYF